VLAALAAMAALAAAASAAPPPPLPELAPAGAADRVLVVAPHVDDEAIAAAGFLADARARGAQVYVVYLTAGDNNRTSARILGRTLHATPAGLLAEGHRRIAEAGVAMGRLGVPPENLFFLGYPDRGLRAMLAAPDQVIRSPGTGRMAVPYEEALSPGAEHRLSNLEADLGRVLARVRPTIVLLPVEFDRHSDHSAAGTITRAALADLGDRPRALGYLVHAKGYPSPFRRSRRSALQPPRQFAGLPWRSFPLSPAGEVQKGKILQAYRSQRSDPYLLLLTGAFVRRNELFLPLDLSRAAPPPQ
jgi:LmbE family N-acetylglucosaminyl deacetylase